MKKLIALLAALTMLFVCGCGSNSKDKRHRQRQWHQQWHQQRC